MNIMAVIPARSGSKGVPDKNIKELSGKPLIAYSILTAQKIKLINRIIVSTDSDEYAALATDIGAEVPFIRPIELSNDDSTDYDFVKHLLDWLIENESHIPDYIIHLRPTTPLRDPDIVENAIEIFMKKPEATSLRSAHEMPETAYKQFELEDKYFKTICTGSFELDDANKSRQSFPKTYTPNGYVDILKTEYILENNLLHGNRVMGYITDFTIEVDVEEDFEFLEWQINKNKKLVTTIFRD
ncbi:MAG: acylneuraminate cytidylyltransferase family protein [Candidatus Marinimicrobia bacterium]|jgi:CMP-N,N'-diacetyllegionaminic acid synthase|nr:acylneuraminate cytidylyltransferase family protein [Candidatus Neomarinimicrobiota bacterium]